MELIGQQYKLKKSSVFLFLLAIAIFIFNTSIVSAQSHSLCGQVNNAADGTSVDWREVTIYYPGDLENNSTCQISPENDRYCCDVDDIPNHNWEIGDIISSRVIDTGDGYYTEAVNTTMTGNGFDIAPEVTLMTLNSGSSSSGGGSSGGGSSASTQDSTAKEKYSEVTNGKPIVFRVSFRTDDGGITELIVYVKEGTKDSSITLTQLSEKPESIVSELQGALYQFNEIETINLEDSNIDKSFVKFRIEQDFFIRNNFDKEDVALMRYNPSINEWEKLDTSKINEDDSFAFFESRSPGFSTFAIIVEGASFGIPGLNFIVNNPNKNLQGLFNVIFVVIIFTLLYYIFVSKKKVSKNKIKHHKVKKKSSR